MLIRLLWDKEKKDILDLIEPFILQVFKHHFSKGDTVDKILVLNELSKKYYLVDFPLAVLITILKRLVIKGILVQKNHEFVIDNDVIIDKDFDYALDDISKKMEIVIKEMADYLKLSYEKDSSKIEDMIMAFLDKYGYLAMVTPTQIDDDNYNMYLISKFIIQHYESKSVIFDYWLEMIEGFMLMQIIYFSSLTKVDIHAKLNKLDVYLDTTLLLRILGYKTNEENMMGNTIINLLKQHKSNVFCFEHNYRELEGIVEFYRDNINYSKDPTLEYFDDMKYSKDDINSIIYDLEINLRKKGIEIVETPTHNSLNVDYDEEKISDFLRGKLQYTKEYNLLNDVKSITAIRRIRVDKNKSNCDKVENSGAIFVTSNWRLCKASNEYFACSEDHIGKKNFSVAINDINLTTLIWIKQNSKDCDLPKKRLIQNAYAATRPSQKLINTAVLYVQDRKYESDSEKEEFRDTLYITLKDNASREDLFNTTQGKTELVPDYIEQKRKEIVDALINIPTIKKELLEKDSKIAELKFQSEIARKYEYTRIERQSKILSRIISFSIFSIIFFFFGVVCFNIYKFFFITFEFDLFLQNIISGLIFLGVGHATGRMSSIKIKIIRINNLIAFEIRKRKLIKEKGKGNPLL